MKRLIKKANNVTFLFDEYKNEINNILELTNTDQNYKIDNILNKIENIIDNEKVSNINRKLVRESLTQLQRDIKSSAGLLKSLADKIATSFEDEEIKKQVCELLDKANDEMMLLIKRDTEVSKTEFNIDTINDLYDIEKNHLTFNKLFIIRIFFTCKNIKKLQNINNIDNSYKKIEVEYYLDKSNIEKQLEICIRLDDDKQALFNENNQNEGIPINICQTLLDTISNKFDDIKQVNLNNIPTVKNFM